MFLKVVNSKAPNTPTRGGCTRSVDDFVSAIECDLEIIVYVYALWISFLAPKGTPVVLKCLLCADETSKEGTKWNRLLRGKDTERARFYTLALLGKSWHAEFSP
jgi:hypothetical protein